MKKPDKSILYSNLMENDQTKRNGEKMIMQQFFCKFDHRSSQYSQIITQDPIASKLFQIPNLHLFPSE